METPLSLDPPQPWPGPKPPEGRPHVWQEQEFGFGDLIDALNPLQHIPIVGTLYRAITGDEIGNVPRVVGDTLFGGPLGFITGMINVALREESGKDFGEHMLALVTPEGAGDAVAGTAVATKPAAADEGGASVTAIAGKDAPDAAAPVAHGRAAAETAVAGQATLPAAAGGTIRSASPFQVAARGDGGGDGRQAFLAQSAASQRRLLGPAAAVEARSNVGAATARPLNNTPVPLQLPPIPGFAQGRPMRSGMAAAAVAAAAMPAQAVPTALPASTAGNAALPSNPPVEISQRMLDALDKYARMQQERSARPAERGGRIDVAQ
jgi:hypothetical protein